MSSGLYNALTDEKLLVAHKEINMPDQANAWKVIEPQQIPFISYWYEWSFSMLKHAALTTLHIQKKALEYDVSLKDASAYNIQFVDNMPIFIDTLSFEKYEDGKPWIAYKQFVEHFLSPLCLMSYVDVRLNRLGESFLDGIPIELTAHMLPVRARLNPRLLFHIFAHASTQKKYSNKKIDKATKSRKFSKRALLGLIDNLEGTIKSLKWSPQGTQWEDYYEEDKNNYKSVSFRHKSELVERFVKETCAKTVWDMGANTGHFSKIAAKSAKQVLAFDFDYGAIEKNYLHLREGNVTNILPLFSDLSNPTPSLGWEGKERMSLFDRGPADTILALALIHHLVFPGNVPFSYLASCFSEMGEYLIIEFIEKSDSQIQILLANRKDIFPWYTQKNFENEFSNYFDIKRKVAIRDSKRTLYLMQKKTQ
jgi:hypothetical protein